MPIAPAARLLTLRGCGGFGFSSSPDGEVIGSTTGLLLLEASLAFGLTTDLHLLRLLSSSEDELSAVEQAINNVSLLAHSVISHLTFSVSAHHQ